ncbi:MAG TPA: hypothetical protein VMZ06_02560 [Candidatus Bathyarchaeia archaeon]|nr:hypothetical protein [Candidatus Bathyarchaeia archaeon]
MFQRVSLLVVSVLMVAMLGGCATGGKGPTPLEQVQQSLAGWSAAAEAKDVDKLMSFVAENFESNEWPDKESYKAFVQDSIDMGYLDDLDVATDKTTITFEGEDKAIAYPVELNASFGSATIKAIFTEEDGKWLVSDVTMEMY